MTTWLHAEYGDEEFKLAVADIKKNVNSLCSPLELDNVKSVFTKPYNPHIIVKKTGDVMDGFIVFRKGHSIGKTKTPEARTYYVLLICSKGSGGEIFKEMEKVARNENVLLIQIEATLAPAGFYKHLNYNFSTDGSEDADINVPPDRATGKTDFELMRDDSKWKDLAKQIQGKHLFVSQIKDNKTFTISKKTPTELDVLFEQQRDGFIMSKRLNIPEEKKNSQEKKTKEKKNTTQKSKGKKGGTSISQSARAGLQFPVGRVARFLRKGRYAPRIGSGAPVYLAAVLEYLTAEVLELAGNAARDNKRTRITPRHIQLAVRNDEELNKMLGGVTIAQGGVLPHIHAVLLPKKKPAKEGVAPKSPKKSPKKKKITKKKITKTPKTPTRRPSDNNPDHGF